MSTTTSRPRHLFVARHGQTALNAEGRLRGLADPPLDEVGDAEACRLATEMSRRGVTVVISSPLTRAWQTAHVVALAAGVPHLVDDSFNDRDYGPHTGHVRAQVEARWGTVDRAPGVEPAENVLRRVLVGVERALETARGGTALVVTHDAVIRPLLHTIDPGRELAVLTGSWNWLARGEDGWSLIAADQVPPGRDEARPA